LIAIGGITLERAPSVYAAGADSIAVVTDIVMNTAPEGRIASWLEF
jgi:thiamine-phosphate pyrophosphorylase